MGRDSRFNLKSRQIVGAGGVMIDPHDTILDRFGRQIGLADMLLHTPHNGLVHGRVAAIQPVLDPNAPPGLVRVVMVATFNFTLQKGVLMQDLILTHTASEEEIATVRRAAGVDGVEQTGGLVDTSAAVEHVDEKPPEGGGSDGA